MIALRLVVASALLALASISAHAAAVPTAAFNKTVTISFTASGIGKTPDGQSKPFSTSVTRVIYVSSAGRLFMRHTATAGRASRGGEFDPDAQSAGKGGSFSFQGNKLVGVLPYQGGARQ